MSTDRETRIEGGGTFRREEKKKSGRLAAEIQGLLSAPSQIADKGAWKGFFSQIVEIQDFMLLVRRLLIDGLQYASMLRNLEEREEGERGRKVANDHELNFSYFNGCIWKCL